VITNPRGVITLKKGRPTKAKVFLPPKIFMLLCPIMLMPIMKTKQIQNFEKKEKDLMNKEFDKEQELNGFIA